MNKQTFVRESRNTLSNFSFPSAFQIDAEVNKRLPDEPAKKSLGSQFSKTHDELK